MKHVYFAEVLFAAFFMVFICTNGSTMAEKKNGNVITDSAMTFTEAVAGTAAPENVLASLCIVDVRYYSSDGHLHQGQLVVHREVRRDVEDLFKLIEKSRFPIEKVIPVARYAWSDESSMADNNTSAFNYRRIEGTDRLSQHASGRAIDINPRLNPVFYRNGQIKPEGASYDRRQPGTLYGRHPVVKMLRARGWTWGGAFKFLKDYHHFEKPD
jgi:peptidoglycan L-alanyl-D-glutamate endopeptidase CwlK